jgi:hypothetical protein
LASEAIKSPPGGFCVEDQDCEKGSRCEDYRCG